RRIVLGGGRYQHNAATLHGPCSLRARSSGLPRSLQRAPLVSALHALAAKAAREGLAAYCFSAGGFASGVGGGSAVGAVPRSPDAAAASPAQSLVPLTG